MADVTVLCAVREDPISLMIAIRRYLGEVDEDWKPDGDPTTEELGEVVRRIQDVAALDGSFAGWDSEGRFVFMAPPTVIQPFTPQP